MVDPLAKNMGSSDCSLNELLSVVGCGPLSQQNPSIKNIVLDSRQVSTGSLFVAIKGSAVDGREYIGAAIRAGAVAVIAESKSFSVEYFDNVVIINIENLCEKLGLIASKFFGDPSEKMHVVAVTGTNGKTTCAQLLQQLFQLLGKKSATIGTMGYGADLSLLVSTGLTTPDAVTCQRILKQLLDDGVECVAMEVSSHAIAQCRHGGIQFEGAVFTNLSRDHLDYHGSMGDYAEIKASLFQSTEHKFVITNLDDDVGAGSIRDAVPETVDCFGYGLKTKKGNRGFEGGSVFAGELDFSEKGICGHVDSCWGEGELSSQLIGQFNAYNLLAVISTACASGYSLVEVLEKVPLLEPIEGRMQKVQVAGDIVVIIDYAHTPDALEQALKAAREHTAKKLWVLFGCGGDRDKGKRPQMAAIAEEYADNIVVTSDNPRMEDPKRIIEDILAGFSSVDKIITEPDRAAAIYWAVNQAASGDMVLFAGKGHEKYQLVQGEKLSFSDYDTASSALRMRAQKNAGGLQ
ncbi:UDP-N-acetylmuramoyl-L-alanyl-D-glutamate--2,6-diaminopimelate ligase [Teredinibacter haidensis]|uniref:UDP-N-acetylmuramoyl-L-alanyl-D-glutamate--2, 6-diaminopimelate ligase n=1 Tax=Teredinibacter haidensis TaxID=2731755 RepID=UPI000AEF0448|nr:UDP-N-acetylmuramoyl-L-alanyl-D-glutamate--2,6-diaminopimelate ligase [Teredinibacter haidensis]